MHQDMISVAAGKILLVKTNWFLHPKIQLFYRKVILAAGGKPSTRFPPGGLVETARIPGIF